MHIGMGLVCGRKIMDMVEAGFDYTIFLADWHSWINNKLGGVMENIHLCGEYFKQCFTAVGIEPKKVTYLWASDLAVGEGILGEGCSDSEIGEREPNLARSPHYG